MGTSCLRFRPATGPASRRAHETPNCAWPPGRVATNTRRRPSGDRAICTLGMDAPVAANVVPSGSVIEKRTTAGAAAGPVHRRTIVVDATAPRSAAVRSPGTTNRGRRAVCATADIVEGVDATQLSSRLMSPALCQRSSGSLARQIEARVVRSIHFAHSAGAQRRQNLVRAEANTRRERHHGAPVDNRKLCRGRPIINESIAFPGRGIRETG
jgi:hypothetical protein